MKLEHSFLSIIELEPKAGSRLDNILREAWIKSIENDVHIKVIFNGKTYFVNANSIFKDSLKMNLANLENDKSGTSD